MARRRRQGFSRKARDLIWVPAISVGVNLTDTVPAFLDLVAGSDWADASSGLEHATVLSIRGQISGIVAFSASSTVGIHAYIQMTDAGLQSQSPALTEPYRQDILWTWARTFEFSASESGIQRDWSVTIDVKAKRRINSSQDLRFVIVVNNASGEMNNIFRTLLNRANG